MKINFPILMSTLILISALSGCNANRDSITLFRGNLERTGIYDTGAKVPSGRLKWKYKAESDWLSSPVVSQGIIYVSGADGHLIALNANNGQESWRFRGKKWRGSPALVSSSTAYFGSMDNSVYAIDIKTGQEKWEFETENYIFSSPTMSEGLIYFGNYDGYFYALNAKTGKEKWKFKTQGTGFLAPGREPATDYELKGAIHSSPAISQGVIYLGSYDTYLYALDASSGQEKWKFKTGGIINDSTPAVVDNVIYVGSEDGYLYAVDDNGQEKWKFNAIDFITIPSQSKQIWVDWISSPATTNENTYFSVSYQWREHLYDDGSDHHWDYLFAVETATGQLKWKIKTTGGAPTLSSNTVYFGDEEGLVFALNAESGQEKWKFNANSAITSEIVVIDGFAYFSAKDGYLYALQ